MFQNIYVYFFFLLCYVEGRPREINCPEYCICDIIETLRRATCQYKKLVSVEIGMPPEAQVLDLAHNQIGELGDRIFLEIELVNLKLLNLSYNRVSDVHLNGFEGLNELKTLDLSYNNLHYFLEQWFVSLSSLQELYLRGNMLKSINQEPHLRFPNLRILDVSLCAIESLKPHTFHKLPNLETLDVSENYLTDLKVDVIKDLKNLNVLIVHGNTLRCRDKSFLHLAKYTRANEIRYDDPCKKSGRKVSNQFERMMVAPSETTVRPGKNVWLYDPKGEKELEIKVVEKCKKNIYDLDAADSYDRYLMEVITLSPVLFTTFTLVFGITLGIFLGCTCQLRGKVRRTSVHEDEGLPVVPPPYRINECRDNRQISVLGRQNSSASNYRPRTKSTGSRKFIKEDRNLLLMNESNLSDSTPVLIRKTLV